MSRDREKCMVLSRSSIFKGEILGIFSQSWNKRAFTRRRESLTLLRQSGLGTDYATGFPQPPKV